MSEQYISIDIGGTFIKSAVIDGKGKVGEVSKVQTPHTLKELLASLQTIVAKQTVQGIAISTPGKVDIEQGMIYHGGALPFLDKVPMKQIMEEQFNIPCALSNDGKAAALAELWLGNLQHVSNGAAIVLGTGVGGGVIINGALLHGSHFQAGELSFLLRSPENSTMQNVIGYSGSAVRLVKEAAKQFGLAKADGHQVFQAFEADENARTFLQAYCREIAFVILNLQAILDLEKVVIGGGISEQPLVLTEIRAQYEQLRTGNAMLSSNVIPVEIATCAFYNNANLLGALYQLLLQEGKL
ncbi:ROK family protein [Enterococcus saccharolyticus]|uniref:ROK family protein n=1 Tax=Candidatus Enterococcus willemsii TaxID=1857215 RepID=A0ABQ6Z3C6_9ENTE|nr:MULTISPECIES: ROK family protein [Enterococcus]KAF1305854.1 hypothetical protein BAU17_13080 [Enterococcus sp. CU12B]MCD5003053.1 ROK family protein [Enterococcus saccharolyticus]